MTRCPNLYFTIEAFAHYPIVDGMPIKMNSPGWRLHLRNCTGWLAEMLM